MSRGWCLGREMGVLEGMVWADWIRLLWRWRKVSRGWWVGRVGWLGLMGEGCVRERSLSESDVAGGGG